MVQIRDECVCKDGYEESQGSVGCIEIDCHNGRWSSSEDKCICFFGYEGERCTTLKEYNNLNSEATGAEITTDADGTVVSTITKTSGNGLEYVSEGLKVGDEDTLYNGYYEVSRAEVDVDHKWVINVSGSRANGMINETGDVCALYIKGTESYQPSGTYTSEINLTNGGDYSYLINAEGDVVMSECENCSEDVTLKNILTATGTRVGILTKGNFRNNGYMDLAMTRSDSLIGIQATGNVINGKDGTIEVINTRTSSYDTHNGVKGILATGVVTNYGNIKAMSQISNNYAVIVGIDAPVVNNYGTIESSEGIWYDYGRGGTFTNHESGTIYARYIEGGYPANGMRGVNLTNYGKIVVDMRARGMVGKTTVINVGNISTREDASPGEYVRLWGMVGTGDETDGLATMQNSGTISFEIPEGYRSVSVYAIQGAHANITNSGKIFITRNAGSDGTLTGISHNIGGILKAGTLTNSGEINVSVSSSGTGISTQGIGTVKNTKTIKVSTGSSATGLESRGYIASEYVTTDITNTGTIEASSANSYAKAVDLGYIQSMANSGKIIASSKGTSARGVVASKSAFVNKNGGQITSTLQSGTANRDAYGIRAESGSVITNESGGSIEVTNTNGYAYGIHADNSTVTNAGTITVKGATRKSYGIYAVNNSTVMNSGTIVVNNDSCTGTGCTNDGVHIYIDDTSSLETAAAMSFSSAFNTSSLGGGTLNLMEGGSIEAPAIEGDVGVASSVVSDGFDESYTLSDAIITNDASNLNLNSQSVMFDAVLEGSDVTLTKKAFSDVVENKSIAEFLENNYALSNNESLYNTLKSSESVKALNSTVKDLMGDGLTRFAFEDMTMMKELTLDMNAAMFKNKEQYFTLTGNTRPISFEKNMGSNSRWMISGKQSGKTSYGVGVAFTNIRSEDGSKKNSREDEMFQMMMPMGYKTHGVEFMVTPRLGYAYGTYERDGYKNESYDGKIEKRIYGVMNEARYPIDIKGWTLSPTAEFNAMGYRIKGHEEDKQFALNINKQNIFSVEAGFGFNLGREWKISEKESLKFNNSIMAYHEFADPYELKLSMRGMDGSWKIRDEKRRKERLMIRNSFEYSLEPFSIYGNLFSYIDSEYRTKADIGFKYAF